MHMATQTKQWTLDELHSLPDDGNKYELVRGELFVTPSPNDEHETILGRLTRILDPFVAANGLGLLYRARAVMRFERSEVEPDLMVRQLKTPGSRDWDEAPTPSLIVEVVSPSTRRREHEHKRRLYVDAGVPEYWIVDPERRSIRIIRPAKPDEVTANQFIWSPPGANESLVVNVRPVFGDA